MIYDVTDYGAVGDGFTNNTKILNSISKEIKQNGGGVMYFPTGEYITGSIHIYSNTTIHIESGAVILGSNYHDDYSMIDPDVVKGYTRCGHWGLISSYNCENISITGAGIIDARGQYWWDSVPSDLVRPRTVSFIDCTNVTIKDVTIKNSPCWTIHPMCCNNVTVDNVSIYNPYHSPNTDGINPESCKNVRITNCHIDVGDDCVTIKSGTEDDTLQKSMPCENVIISGCTMAHGHGGVVFGSEMSGGINNVTVSGCVFQDTDRGIRIKTRRKRGGYVTGLNINNIIMDNVQSAITMNEYYRCGVLNFSEQILFSTEPQLVDELTPVISDVSISNVIAKNVRVAGVYLYGLPEMPISNVSISNITIDVIGNTEGIEPIMTNRELKSYGDGIYLENVEDINMSNISLQCPKDEFTVNNAANITYNGIIMCP